ncbi:23S rRNA (uracil(1939)-C(5))-methyltransferase RlmD [Patescibacteria group bacterium]|nr:23S rRNA (uracil(1939)-C(5))-methyltransferase RlmD [Patescibacteria group bacterium]
MKFGDRLRGTITEIDEKGRGVFIYELPHDATDTRRVLIPFTAIGDEIEATFVKRDQGQWIGRLEQIITPAADRIKAPCPHVGVCGGCLWQHLSYEAQCALKHERITRSFAKAGFTIELPALRPSTETLYYRNRMDYAFGWQEELGLKEYGSWNRYIDVKECLLLDKETPEILAQMREFVKKYSLPAWDAKRQEGLTRYTVIRRGQFTNERLVMLVVKDLTQITTEMKEDLKARFTTLATSLLVGENPAITDLSFVERYETLQGSEYLHEEINGIRYKIHPNSFFQTNSAMACVLQTAVLDLIGSCEGKTILDLYCGLGFFGIACAKRGATVFGHELDANAIVLAKENATQNSVAEKTTFSAGTVETYTWETDTPDLVIIDPPRAGLHPKALETLMAKAPPVIVYVSCNYNRLVEELKTLTTAYKIDSIQAFDLFPQTPHVEVLVKLVRI